MRDSFITAPAKFISSGDLAEKWEVGFSVLGTKSCLSGTIIGFFWQNYSIDRCVVPEEPGFYVNGGLEFYDLSLCSLTTTLLDSSPFTDGNYFEII